MPGPLDALKKASHIGPDAQGEFRTQMENAQPTLSMMPLDPSGARGILELGTRLPEILSGLRGALSREAPSAAQAIVPRSAYPAAETLGEMSPEFTAVGGEDMYNIGRPSTKLSDPVESAFQRVRAGGGRPAAPPSPMSVHPFDLSNPMPLHMQSAQDMLNPKTASVMEDMYRRSVAQKEANPALKALYDQIHQAADAREAARTPLR